MRTIVWPLGVALLSIPAVSQAADDTMPGEPSAPYPTLHNISIEWPVTGDDDADGSVTVRFRPQGESEFRDALPLFRVPAGQNQGFSWGNKHAGSIFGLAPDTTYEIQLELTDPDGGDASETLTVKTRAMPNLAPGSTQTIVTPETIGDVLASAGPGTELVLSDGTYGEIVVLTDGSPAQPITLRAANEGGAIVEGDVRIDGRSYVTVDGLVVHGKFKFNDAESIVVHGCTIETPDDGIVSYGGGVANAYIADNVITGPTVWYEGALGVDGDNLGEGVQITGPGNVVAFNRVSGFRDCLSLLEDDEAVNQVSIDFYGNDLSECADDAIEADFSMGNVRVYQNRIADSFMGISSQPSLGGPTYFTRNVMFNIVFQAFKLQRASVGDIGLHNTVIKSGDAFSVNTTDPISRAWFRGNLFIGGPGADYNGYDSGPGDVIQLATADASCSFDYDGYGSIGAGAFAGDLGDVSFDSLAALQSTTSEAHAVQVDLSSFDAAIQFPTDPFSPPTVPAFTLAADGAAVDAGTPLANVNDGFAGAAPDLGAIELGQEEPVYGPGGTLGTGGGGGGTGNGGNGAGGGGAGGPPSGGGSGAGGGPGADVDEGGCDCRSSQRSGRGFSLLALGLSLLALRRRVRGARSIE